MSNSSYKRLQRLNRIKNGLCTTCGNNPPRADRRLCSACAKHASEFQKAKHQRLIDIKVCIRCKKSVRYQRYKICQECRRKELDAKRKAHEEHGMCKSCGRNPAQAGKKNCKPCVERLRENNIKRRTKRRKIVLDHYGHKCSCPGCDVTKAEFLTVDHINGGGAEHRREIGRGSYIYSWLIKQGFPDGHRLLCFNCNCSRGTYHYCPHNDIVIDGKTYHYVESMNLAAHNAGNLPRHYYSKEEIEEFFSSNSQTQRSMVFDNTTEPTVCITGNP